MSQSSNLFRIALTSSANLPSGYFQQLGIRRPTNCDFKDYSQLTGQSTGAQAKLGYNRVTLSWDLMTRFELYLLESYQRQVSSTQLIYLTIERTDGLMPGTAWFNVSGKPQVITYTNEPNVRDQVLSGVTWLINNVLILGAAY